MTQNNDPAVHAPLSVCCHSPGGSGIDRKRCPRCRVETTHLSLAHDEALALLERAEQCEEFIAEQGKTYANAWQTRQARHEAEMLREHAAVCATLAVAEELRKVCDQLGTLARYEGLR